MGRKSSKTKDLMRIAGLTRGDRGPAVHMFYDAHKNPTKYFDNFADYKKFADISVKPSSRNPHTDQKAINAWVMAQASGDLFKDKDKDKNKDKKKKDKKKEDFSYDKFLGSSGGEGKGGVKRGKGGAGGEGGKGSAPGKRTKGIEDKGLEFYGQFDTMTPAEFDLFKEVRLRNVDGENAQALQNIINSGKIEVASIQRDASIYGSLVSGFW